MKTNKSKYTPGPWNIQVSDASGPFSIQNYEMICICLFPNPDISWTVDSRRGEIVHFDKERIELNKANAALIAAAPEMLECLELFMDAFDESKNGKEKRQRLLGIAITSAEKAIKKARGE